MAHFLKIIITLAFGSMLSVQAAPIVPGLQGNHPLNEAQTGILLWEELRCASCHGHGGQDNMKSAPDLREVGSRVSPAFLKAFIASPHSKQSDTTMPDVLKSLSENKRNEVAEAISQFLISKSKEPFKYTQPDAKSVEKGKELFTEVGCMACHSDPAGRQGLGEGVSLTHVGKKYSLDSLSAFLFNPLHVRASGRMPDMKLSKAEARNIASYLIGDTKADDSKPSLERSKIEKGKAYFIEHNCNACHQLEDTMVTRTKPLVPFLKPFSPRSMKACVEAGDEFKRGVYYDLDKTQVAALRAAAKIIVDRKVSPHEQIAMTLTRMNCIACHKHDDFGGVPAAKNHWFTTSEMELGNNARIPPDLTGVGGKLQLEWMHKVLFDGERVRPYMKVSMPQYGMENLKGLPELFQKADLKKPPSKLVIEGDARKEMRMAGRKLIGSDGFACITCHNFDGKPSPGFHGLDIMTTTERLNPDWFEAFLRNPAKYHPGTIMPNYFPGGKSVQATVLGGDTDKQIDAIKYYLSMGRSARTPKGMSNAGHELEVTDKVRTYRGRSRVAGFRGIAVGYPEKINYAFNAQNGALTALWLGKYVSANWNSQGAGDFNPRGKVVQLAQDTAFYVLPNDKAAWPLAPVKTKEKPVNPDPLYPRKYGYQFKGYFLGENDLPTLKYDFGPLEIQDTAVAVLGGDKPKLKRTISINTSEKHTVWFRALTGNIKAVPDGRYATKDLRVAVSGGEVMLRNSGVAKIGKELLLKLELPKGQSKLTLEYEILKK